MKNHFKKYWFIWLVQIAVISVYFYALGHVGIRDVVLVVCFELIFILSFIYVGWAKNKVIQDNGRTIMIKGIFKKLEVNKKDIERVEIKRNFICMVMDWSLVIITTGTETYGIYTRQIKNFPAGI